MTIAAVAGLASAVAALIAVLVARSAQLVARDALGEAVRVSERLDRLGARRAPTPIAVTSNAEGVTVRVADAAATVPWDAVPTLLVVLRAHDGDFILDNGPASVRVPRADVPMLARALELLHAARVALDPTARTKGAAN